MTFEDIYTIISNNMIIIKKDIIFDYNHTIKAFKYICSYNNYEFDILVFISTDNIHIPLNISIKCLSVNSTYELIIDNDFEKELKRYLHCDINRGCL